MVFAIVHSDLIADALTAYRRLEQTTGNNITYLHIKASAWKYILRAAVVWGFVVAVSSDARYL